MNMKQLRYFLAVAEELNFTRAAAKVNIAQPPLSQQIMALEAELGTPLFIREKRKVELTEAGRILVVHAHRVLNAASAAIGAVRAAERGANAKLTVGAIYSSIYAFLPVTLRVFRSIEPRTEVSIQEMTINQQVHAIKEGRIEIGMVRGHVYDSEITTEHLFRERLVLAVPHNMMFASDEIIDVQSLAEMPLVAVTRGPTRGYGDRILNIFEQEDLQPRAWVWRSCLPRCSFSSRAVCASSRLRASPPTSPSRLPGAASRYPLRWPPFSTPRARTPRACWLNMPISSCVCRKLQVPRLCRKGLSLSPEAKSDGLDKRGTFSIRNSSPPSAGGSSRARRASTAIPRG